MQRCSTKTWAAATTEHYETTDRTQLKRYAKRAEYDKDVVHAILDEVAQVY